MNERIRLNHEYCLNHGFYGLMDFTDFRLKNQTNQWNLCNPIKSVNHEYCLNHEFDGLMDFTDFVSKNQTNQWNLCNPIKSVIQTIKDLAI